MFPHLFISVCLKRTSASYPGRSLRGLYRNMLTEFYRSPLSESSLLFTDEEATLDRQSVNKDAMNLAN